MTPHALNVANRSHLSYHQSLETLLGSSRVVYNGLYYRKLNLRIIPNGKHLDLRLISYGFRHHHKNQGRNHRYTCWSILEYCTADLSNDERHVYVHFQKKLKYSLLSLYSQRNHCITVFFYNFASVDKNYANAPNKIFKFEGSTNLTRRRRKDDEEVEKGE